MFLKKLSIGLKAGFLAGFVMDVIDYLLYFLVTVHTTRSIDWVALFILGRKSSGFPELLLVQALHFLFTALLGGVFIFLASAVKKTNIFLKGWVFGVLIWFIVVIVTNMSELPSLSEITTVTLFIHLLLASVYGVLLAAAIPIFILFAERQK